MIILIVQIVAVSASFGMLASSAFAPDSAASPLIMNVPHKQKPAHLQQALA